MNDVNVDTDMAIVMTLIKFGQKDSSYFDLHSLVHTYGVVNMSYHVACEIHPDNPAIDLLWSRCGLQEVVGQR